MLPLVGAFNGWITTKLAIHGLFRPRHPVRIFGLRYQAPLPKRQAEIAARIGEIVEAELLSYSDIRQRVVTADFILRISEAIESKIGEILFARRASLPSIARKLIPDEMVTRLQKVLAREVAGHLTELIDEMFILLSENVQIRHLIEQKVASFELARLEEVIFSLAAKELRLIELSCGALGFLIGVVQMLFSR
jgi:uncharacterized membrane protein YheB (UPF0754 family)